MKATESLDMAGMSLLLKNKAVTAAKGHLAKRICRCFLLSFEERLILFIYQGARLGSNQRHI